MPFWKKKKLCLFEEKWAFFKEKFAFLKKRSILEDLFEGVEITQFFSQKEPTSGKKRKIGPLTGGGAGASSGGGA